MTPNELKSCKVYKSAFTTEYQNKNHTGKKSIIQ